MAANSPSEEPRPDFSEALRALKRDPTGKGFHCLCGDGVWRTFDSQRNIVDAYRLIPAEIKQRLDREPWVQTAENLFRGVDGRGVPDEQLFNPPQEVLPKKKSAERKAELRAIIERQKTERREGAARGEIEEKSACGLVESDYDLRPKVDGQSAER